MLPVMTKPDDAVTVATYLNTKVTGATLQDAKATLEGRVLDCPEDQRLRGMGTCN